jgi:hypothetical protein
MRLIFFFAPCPLNFNWSLTYYLMDRGVPPPHLFKGRLPTPPPSLQPLRQIPHKIDPMLRRGTPPPSSFGQRRLARPPPPCPHCVKLEKKLKGEGG